MNIHEYQAKQLLKAYGCPVSNGVPVFEASEAKAAAEKLGGPLWVVKSQIHAGGRGKGTFKEAIFSKRIGSEVASQVLVGSEDVYIPVCRNCY